MTPRNTTHNTKDELSFNSNGKVPPTEHEEYHKEGFQFLGVDFAPLTIPLQRRLQTLAVILILVIFFLLGFISTGFLIWLLFTSYKWITLLYVMWYFWDIDVCNRGGRRSQWVREWRIWKYYADYFPIKLIKTADLDPGQNYFMGSHPHGLYCAGAFASFCTEGTNFSKLFPGITPHLLTLEGMHQIPGYREILQKGGSCAITSRSIDYLLTRSEGGQAVVAVIGGAREVLNLESHPIELVIKSRKGFIKKALIHGASLVPTFSFGEIEIYDPLIPNPKGSRVRRVQEWLLGRFRFPFMPFLGRGIFQYSFGALPRRKPINVVVGRPISVKKNENPTPEEIDALHKRYIEDLNNLYEKYKGVYGNPNAKLYFT